MSRLRLTRGVVLSILFAFATALQPLVAEDGRNYLVIFISIISIPLIFILRIAHRKEISLVIFVILIPFLIQAQIAGISTILHTIILASAYFVVFRGIQIGCVRSGHLIKLFAWIILLYSIMGILQLLALQIGLPIPNQIFTKGGWSFNLLAPEPSHAARVLSFITITYYVLIQKSEFSYKGLSLIYSPLFVLFAFSVGILLTGSALGFIAFVLVVGLTLKRSLSIIFILALLLAWPVLYECDISSVQRSTDFVLALPTMDMMQIIQADHSGAIRVMPLFIFLEKASPANFGFWTGGGFGAIAYYVQGELIGVDPDAAMAGFIPGYLMTFGAGGTLIFLWVFLFRFLNKTTSTIAFMWVVFCSTGAWNFQVFWLGLMLIRCVFELQHVEEWKLRASLRVVKKFNAKPIGILC
jgi:hypothetical protein